jgi:hypothetical protein
MAEKAPEKESSSESVQVAVRCRPFNSREKAMNSPCIVQMDENQQTIITNLENGEEKKYSFDYSYWSHEPKSDRHINNTIVYDTLGRGVLHQAIKGFNACVFAYGQTGVSTLPHRP